VSKDVGVVRKARTNQLGDAVWKKSQICAGTVKLGGASLSRGEPRNSNDLEGVIGCGIGASPKADRPDG